ncbi:MAG: M20/M25/M40 family metallo-hydrolase [Kordiimonadaceae bacterium]|nr:M20/M25/M40 family metallo-hydrolase [Kordiimonadaceae bacterium]
MFMKSLCLLSVVFLIGGGAAAIDKTEQDILSAIESGLPHAVDVLEKSVNINSGTMNFAGVRKVGALFDKELTAIGFKTEWLDGSGFGRSGHLVASYGTKGPKILLIGHLDTVFSSDDAFQKFERLEGNKVRGPGITDMKGGDVIMIAAVSALKSAGVLDKVQIRIVMTGDEESSGAPLSGSKDALIEAAKWADIALGFEDGDGNVKTAVIARRGSVAWSLDVTGVAAHSSQIFTADVGYGAVFEAARVLNEFREKLSTVENLTFNPGRIVGGTRINAGETPSTSIAFGKNNVVAKTLRVTGGIRALSPAQLQDAKEVMQAVVNDNLAKTTATLTFADGYPPMAPTDGNRALLRMYDAVSQSLGYGPVLAVNPRKAGAADISFTSGYVYMALDGLGLMGTGGHTKDEIADMNTLKQNIEKAALLIYRLSLTQ